MKHFTTSLRDLDTHALKVLSQEYRDLIIAIESTDQTLRDRLFCIDVELIDRSLRNIPNVEKYSINRTTGVVSVFFGAAQSKDFDLNELIKGA